MFAHYTRDHGEAMKQLNSMNVDELLAVKARIDAAISSRIERERKLLTASLQRLDSIAGKSAKAPRKALAGGHTKRKSLAAKYRNPSSPRETWAGRGLKPRWLVAALKDGKKLSDFAIDRTRK